MSEPRILAVQAADRRQRGLAVATVIVSAAIFLAAAPFAKTPLAPMPAFLPAYQAALVVNELVTAVLLFGQFGILRSRALLVLAGAYLFSALMALAHALSFPGLFLPTGLLGAGPQTTAWIYFLWHAGFPLFVIAYALIPAGAASQSPPFARPRLAMLGCIAATLALAGGLTLFTTAGHPLLPAIMAGNQDAPAKVYAATASWALSLAALPVLWRRRPHSVLDLWLMVVMCVWVFEIALASVLNGGRFDLGWYAGRIYGLLAGSFVLVLLLLENSVLYARLAEDMGRRADAERRLSERLGLLHEVDRAVLAEQPAEAIAAAVIQPLRELLGVPRAIVNRFDLVAGEVEWVAAAGRRRTHVGGGVRYSIRLMGDLEAMRRGEPQRIDVLALPDGPDKDALLASGVRIYLAVPMIAGGELIGAISFGGEAGDFPDEQVHIAQEVAAQLAISITQARLLQRVKQQASELERRVEERTAALNSANRELRLLHEATLEISKAPDSMIALTVLLEKVCEFTGWVYGQTWLPEAKKGLAIGPAWTRSIPGLEAFRRANEAMQVAPPGGALERVWKTRQPEWIWDLRPDPAAKRRPLMLQAGLRSWIGFPVLADGEVVAVLDFFDTEYRPRDESVLRLIVILATQIGPVIAAKRSAEEIRRLNAELQTTNQELESFSYSVSHDLRAPLRAIDGYARMLEEDYAERFDDEARRLLGVVRASSVKMGQLIDDLLAFSRLGRQEPAKRPVDMTALAREVLGEHAPVNGAAVDMAMLPAANADRALIKQVWLNLVGNALKYSARQGAPRVEIGGSDNGAEAVYWVRDNGVGFDMRYAAKLFGVFQRLHRAEEFPGTGVGLAIVQRVVARHGGRVWAESEVGKGACFYFALPK